MVFRFDEFYIELVVIPGKVTQRFLTYVSIENMFVIDMDEYAGLGLPALLHFFAHELAPNNFSVALTARHTPQYPMKHVSCMVNALHRSFDRSRYDIIWQVEFGRESGVARTGGGQVPISASFPRHVRSIVVGGQGRR